MKTKKSRTILFSSSIAVGVLALLMVGLFAGGAQAQQGGGAEAYPIGPSVPVSGNGITPTLWNDNPDCGDIGYGYGFKINAWDTEDREGTFLLVEDGSLSTVLTGGAPADPSNSVTISNVVESNGDKIRFDWAATLGIDAVIVKYASVANVYVYDPEAMSDTGLGSNGVPPINGISHVEFCYDYGTRVRKYLDANQNFEQDPDEPGLEGWTIQLISDTQVLTEVTDSDGYADFGILPGGTYTLCEDLESGWTNYEPEGAFSYTVGTEVYTPCQRLIVNGNHAGELLKFGNYPDNGDGIKMGRKFHDANANGIEDEGEMGLSGWEIHLFSSSGSAAAYTATTQSDGCFSALVNEGCYTVCEVLEDGWTQSYPQSSTNGGGLSVSSTNDKQVVDCSGYGNAYGKWGYYECIEAREVISDNVFGNYTNAVKTGMKFEDFDGNGEMDDDDIPLEGWTIHLDGIDFSDKPVAMTETTDANGYYTFTVAPGTYTVCEEIEDGWNQTYPVTDTGVVDCPDEYGGGLGYRVELKSGEIHGGNDFGNDPQLARVRGCKYNDLDGDGNQDQGDPELAGWEICLDGLGCKTTLSDGCTEYWDVSSGSAYTLIEEDREGWDNTDPGDGTLSKTTAVLSSGEEAEEWFGNYEERIVGGATSASSALQMLIFRLTVIALTALLASGAGVILWRRKVTQR